MFAALAFFAFHYIISTIKLEIIKINFFRNKLIENVINPVFKTKIPNNHYLIYQFEVIKVNFIKYKYIKSIKEQLNKGVYKSFFKEFILILSNYKYTWHVYSNKFEMHSCCNS